MGMMTYEQGLEAMRCADSYTRAPIVLDLQQHMERSDWLRILRDEWDVTDNLFKFRRQIGGGRVNSLRTCWNGDMVGSRPSDDPIRCAISKC
jgi:hypothetical protein